MEHSKDQSSELAHARERALVVMGDDRSIQGDFSLREEIGG